ncbi:ion transporter [Flavobacterium psychrophilum]|uniref:Probable ion transporter n=1 Tax=Flavobacterium psychrophilum (strain ATCC 49511 / DSM 21280 / CIP 103535 / JIP02/86) TaxID=402612 RepID=A6GYY3_FLAPJ|nr:potassium channel family protein [Flavobacterium psychrophilum]AIG30015.1 ion transporter [Flavobacterium psychrophilum]AIG32291.1 ion transporter [Flavobacterium psychrophilum]AIG34449.1 ion transporter [Flavobacterium psychrophilum]AIG36809.1 ion transporter [Flavobacterium psychrophilum]AIG39073.1 ion transporter [Flavobacterium psychrophilum]
MNLEKSNEIDEKLGYFNIIILVLTIYVLGALLVETFCALPKETAKLLNFIDKAICLIFFIDFVVRFFKAKNKLKFMRWGWIDLVSSIPVINYFRAGRLLRLIRLLRVIRAFRSSKQLVNHVFKNKAKGTFTSVSIFAILLIIFSAIAILQVENTKEGNIKSAEDAIWWAYVTITTVGYGDKFPVTTEGRLIAVVLMTAGVGLFGTFTAYASSWFVEDKIEIKKEQS